MYPVGSVGSKRPRPKNLVRYPFFGGILEPSLLPLGAVLGPSWGRLGFGLALQSPLWAVLGRLGASLQRVAADFAAKWNQMDAFPLACHFRMSFFDFIFDTFWNLTCVKKQPKSF